MSRHARIQPVAGHDYHDADGPLTRPAARMAVRLRDGNECYICKAYVPEGLPQKDPRHATLDHVIEAASGGSSSIINLRLAHRSCNEARGKEFNRLRRLTA